MSQSNGVGDVALVVRCRSGDRAAFEQLVHRSARSLFVRIYLDIPDAHRAEDLVQETFLRAWKKIGSLADPKTFRPWLYSIAKGVVLDAVKRDSRKKRGFGFLRRGKVELMSVADESASPVQSFEQAEQRREMLEKLKSLPQEYQDVLTLRYLAGADYQEISRQLAISNGSLRGLLNRGMRMLREKMQDQNKCNRRDAEEDEIG